MSVAAWLVAGRQVEQAAIADFANQANLAANLVDRRVQRYVDLLYGLEAFSAQERELTRREFNAHAAAVQAGRRFPGVQGIQFVRRVPREQADAFVRAVRSDRSVSPLGYPGFDIRPRTDVAEHWVIDYVEPLAGNEVAFGLDLQSRALPRLALER